jgi:uncharacterized protein (DUF433 family)
MCFAGERIAHCNEVIPPKSLLDFAEIFLHTLPLASQILTLRHPEVITMKDWRNCDAVERHSDRVSGAWVFRATRVPVSALFENLKDGASIEQFLEWFPGAKRLQVESFLDSKNWSKWKLVYRF